MCALMEPPASSKELFEKEALKHLDELFGSAMRMTRQKEAAEDLVSERVLAGGERGAVLRLALARGAHDLAVDAGLEYEVHQAGRRRVRAVHVLARTRDMGNGGL